jgi:hypothetical protein
VNAPVYQVHENCYLTAHAFAVFKYGIIVEPIDILRRAAAADRSAVRYTIWTYRKG